MKRKHSYSFFISKNHSSQSKVFTIEGKTVHILFGALAGLLFLLTFFLTNYFGLHLDQWQFSQLKKENKQLEQKFARVNLQLKDLEKRVHQVSDFSRKLQLITNVSPNVNYQKMGFGKTHSSSTLALLSIAHPSNNRSPSSVNSSLDESTSHTFKDFTTTNANALEVRMEKLKEKSELVKQNTWTLYTNLMEKKEILNNTPSIMPVKGWVSSSFGYRNETIYSDHEYQFHRGVDIASTQGNPVMASADGKVVYTGYDEFGYGNLIVIDHGYGLRTYYAHLAEININIGNTVKRSDIIASVGSTGRSTGPHLHYEIRIFNKPVNPDNYILNQSNFLVY